MDYAKLGERIHQQRKLAKLTQQELADAANISVSFLGHLERGTRRASLETMVSICNALKISPNLLLQDSLNDDLLGQDRDLSDDQRKHLREITNAIIDYSVGSADLQQLPR